VTITDLFAGPGGMDVAAKALGVESVGFEWDEGALATRLAAGLATVPGDVRDHGPADVADSDVLAGGPPCQGFSVTGKGEGRRILPALQRRAKAMAARQAPSAEDLDERSSLVLEPLRWILEAKDAGRPYRAVVLEQVPQALPVWQTYAEILRAEGYAVTCGTLRTEQYGDPSLAPYMTMGAALPDRGPFTVVSNYGTGGDPKRRGRRTQDEPAFTITGKISRVRLVGPDGEELPRFTWAEAGRLQDFPMDHPWSGRDISQQIGNACPVGLARHLFQAVGVGRPPRSN
jgi:DNA (cytosine-5)-methyltransferase 1